MIENNNLNSNDNCDTKININKENIARKNNFRKDSYCTSIEKKRKALGLEFRPNFQRELSIQTEKNADKKKKIIARIQTSKITFENNNIHKNNLFEDYKLIKVRKNIVYNKYLEKKNQYFKKSIEKINHGLIKNKTLTNFNYNKNNLSNTFNNDLNEIRNKKYKNNNFTFLNNNDNLSNKTSDFDSNSIITYK